MFCPESTKKSIFAKISLFWHILIKIFKIRPYSKKKKSWNKGGIKLFPFQEYGPFTIGLYIARKCLCVPEVHTQSLCRYVNCSYTSLYVNCYRYTIQYRKTLRLNVCVRKFNI